MPEPHELISAGEALLKWAKEAAVAIENEWGDGGFYSVKDLERADALPDEIRDFEAALSAAKAAGSR